VVPKAGLPPAAATVASQRRSSFDVGGGGYGWEP
jgi:hypothetical protein